MTIPITTRPRPLVTVARQITKGVTVISALITSLVGVGIVTAAQGDAVTGLLGAIPGIVGGVFGVLAAFGVVRGGEPLVTPSSDPRDDRGVRLVPDGRPLFDIDQQ
ncbi:MAG TPA: hypothetical protein VM677_27245 [Actinokineospora sp.]|nr:hypothetical protein [Actinokineospora sp.]